MGRRVYKIWFAWYPIEIEGGGHVWFKNVKRAWDSSLDGGGDPSGWFIPCGGWVYKEIK